MFVCEGSFYSSHYNVSLENALEKYMSISPFISQPKQRPFVVDNDVNISF